MSYLKEPKSSKFDRDPALASPLAAAISAQDRETLAMVASALKDRRMRLAFQPVVYAADPSVIGFFEGFIRLLNLRDQVIPARDFMGAVEQQQLGREIDCAALQLGLMAMQRNPQIRVSINMSARSVGYRPWTDILRRALQDSPRLGANLILEISEASALQVPDVLKPFMSDMREHGIVFALDDFGAGMTSLRVLQDLGFEIAKIDGSLVKHVDRLSEGQAVVRAAIAMAEELGMYVVAEAVETEGEATWLREAGVGCLQGYLFGPPTVTPDFRAFRHGRPTVTV
ncbi:EAL domain-containing protein [Tabrizicola sp.]|jgi:EAL domain-containing protein (putative c-di-GMP-specific phosphodiesterase class I)|uniref:EAL domain-containing protein n=1 Tax=Tabrizicola sp. TaxID=2005166 RepID=UPI001A614223|nr:EAL domain-containing protein [Tabrizicola sp.]MBL9063888.1 EAL domain-containing protein [Tabrizicola sp.]